MGRHTMSRDILSDLGHRITHGRVGVQEVMMFVGVPFAEGRKLLRNSLEESNNDTNRSRLHVSAEFIHCGSVLAHVSNDNRGAVR
jgi:hypothetical protein